MRRFENLSLRTRLLCSFGLLIAKTAESLHRYNDTRAALGGMVGEVADVAGTLTASSREMASTSEQAGRAVGAVERIGAGARSAERDIAEVASVAEESSAAAEQVSASTQQTSAATQQIASGADELAQRAVRLAALVERFTVR